MATSRKSEFAVVARSDRLALAFGMHGVFHDGPTGRDVGWRAHRTPQGLALFAGARSLVKGLGIWN